MANFINITIIDLLEIVFAISKRKRQKILLRIIYILVEENCKLKQALIKHRKFNDLYLLPAAQTKDKTSVNEQQMK